MATSRRPLIGLYYRYWIFDADGRLIKYQRRTKARSFVRAFFEAMRALWEAEDDPAVVDIASGSQILIHDAQTTTDWGDMSGPVGDTDRGIVFGSGSTAAAMGDNALVSLIAEGTAGGQMEYQAQVTSAAAIGATESTLALTRQAINNSGGDVTLREIGTHMTSAITTTTTAVFLSARDVLPSDETIPDGGSFVWEYTIRMAV